MPTGAFINHSIFTPQRFAKLAPYLQTEAALLAVECGNSVDVIAASLNVPTRTLRVLMAQRHGHAIAMPDYLPVNQDEAPEAAFRIALRDRVLRWMRQIRDDDGIVRGSTVDIAEALGVRTASAARSVRELADAGFIACVAPGGSQRMAHYRVTDAGMRRIEVLPV